MTEAATPKSSSIKVSPEPDEPSPLSGPCHQIGYSHGFYGQYPPAPPTKQEDLPICVPGPQPYFIPSLHHVQPQFQHIPNPESIQGYPPQSFYQPTMLPTTYHHAQYPVFRPDIAPLQVPNAYPINSLPVYAKQQLPAQNQMAYDPRNERPELSH